MNVKLQFPKIKQSKKLLSIQKRYQKKWRLFQKNLSKKVTFIRIWRNNTAEWLARQGQKIVAVSPPWLRRLGGILRMPFAFINRRIKLFLLRRPHRSFRLTRRRDYKRSLKLPGYWSFTNSVRAMLWKHWRLFGGLALVYLVLAFAFNSFGQQEAYQNLSDVLNQAGGEVFKGQWGQVGSAGLLLLASVTTGLTPNVTAAQTVLGGLTVFLVWLATIWALRNVMAGRRVKIRDAVYNSGSPIISTILVSFMLVVQLLPLSIAILIYSAAVNSQLIQGVENMLAWVAVALLGILSLYWMIGTVIAMVIVTLPGMYPWRAIQTAGDLVTGRRLRIILRILWMMLLIVISWAVLLIPIILFDDWIKKVWPAIAWMPIVPFSILVMSSVTIIFAATYVYMLYRKVVADDAKPA